MTANTLRIAFVPGVTLRKWTRSWEERHPETPLEILPIAESEIEGLIRAGDADVGFVRLPIERDGLSVVRIYGELPVLVVSRDHELATRESVTAAEVEALPGVVGSAPGGRTKDAVELVAAGVGSLRLPHSLARLHARKDVAAIPIEDGAETDIAVVWLADALTADIEEFVGIVRGRTAASSRSSVAVSVEEPAQPRKTARAAPTKQKPHRITGNRAQARNRKGRGR